MSANDTPEIAPNSPTLLAMFDSVAAPTPDSDPDPDPEFETGRPRRPPEADTPPRGASRNLGGTCPECGAAMTTRLRAEYAHGAARLRLTGFCMDPEACGYAAEGTTESVGLEEKQL